MGEGKRVLVREANGDCLRLVHEDLERDWSLRTWGTLNHRISVGCRSCREKSGWAGRRHSIARSVGCWTCSSQIILFGHRVTHDMVHTGKPLSAPLPLSSQNAVKGVKKLKQMLPLPMVKDGNDGREILPDPLQWRATKARDFPLISRLARHPPAIPTLQAPSERLFSGAGLTMTKKRKSLSKGNVKLLVSFRNSWAAVGTMKSTGGNPVTSQDFLRFIQMIFRADPYVFLSFSGIILPLGSITEGMTSPPGLKVVLHNERWYSRAGLGMRAVVQKELTGVGYRVNKDRIQHSYSLCHTGTCKSCG